MNQVTRYIAVGWGYGPLGVWRIGLDDEGTVHVCEGQRSDWQPVARPRRTPSTPQALRVWTRRHLTARLQGETFARTYTVGWRAMRLPGTYAGARRRLGARDSRTVGNRTVLRTDGRDLVIVHWSTVIVRFCRDGRLVLDTRWSTYSTKMRLNQVLQARFGDWRWHLHSDRRHAPYGDVLTHAISNGHRPNRVRYYVDRGPITFFPDGTTDARMWRPKFCKNERGIEGCSSCRCVQCRRWQAMVIDTLAGV